MGDPQTGEGPPGLAVRTDKPCWINDILTNPAASGWAAVARGRWLSVMHRAAVDCTRPARGPYFAALSICILESANALMTELSITMPASASCLTHAVAALRGHLAGDLTSGVKSLRASQQRKRAEDALQATRAELARASRMTSLGHMAASIAHEISQPLATIVAERQCCLAVAGKQKSGSRGGAGGVESACH